ncbi:hypothetical protein BZARG_2074 [Bizionia argentinensis JUB59]|uniref:Uncharacterized protein n=1 Tax=Bizionia argentinensis JUB59 TaxID=1046627 RepID=G2EFE0_9FLAO|nr:hypothetical protein [Bizionia argentinensis]EGV42904.1 hypothetical protein BZARG_2074 [Bizionia argentinensis JUB59]
MKNYLLILICFLVASSYSQSTNTIYLLINKKDTLIKKQVATKVNEYEGYRITDEKRIVTVVKRSSTLKGDDIEYDAFSSNSFSFNRKNDTIISKSYLNTLKPIKDRRQFIDCINHLNTAQMKFIFIEAKKCDKFILRKVHLLKFE